MNNDLITFITWLHRTWNVAHYAYELLFIIQFFRAWLPLDTIKLSNLHFMEISFQSQLRKWVFVLTTINSITCQNTVMTHELLVSHNFLVTYPDLNPTCQPKYQTQTFYFLSFWGLRFLFALALFIWIFIMERKEQMVLVTVENLRRFIMCLWGLSERGTDLKKQEHDKRVHMSHFGTL